MLTVEHKLTVEEALAIKKNLLWAAGQNTPGVGLRVLASDLIEAFRLVDQATQSSPASTSTAA